MKKTTTLEFTGKTGRTLTFTIVRNHGKRISTYTDDGVEYEMEVFDNNFDLYLESKDCGIEKTREVHIKDDESIIVCDFKTQKRITIPLPKEFVAKIKAATSEILTDEIPSDIEKEIKVMKEAISKGFVLPSADIKEKKQEYADRYLDGGDGYNPFDYYISIEQIEAYENLYNTIIR